MKCKAHLPSKQANGSLHNAIWHAGFLHSIEKKSVALCVYVCVFCFFVFLVGWWEGAVFFFLCFKRSVKDLFFAIAHFDSAFSLYVWRRYACYSFSQSSTFCMFFFHKRLFLFLIGCLAYFLHCWIVCNRLLLLRRANGVFAAAFAEVDVTEFCIPGILKCASFHLLCCFIGMISLDCEWYTLYD